MFTLHQKMMVPLFVGIIFGGVNYSWGMEQPPSQSVTHQNSIDQTVIDKTRAITGGAMIVSGTQYLRSVHAQQTNPVRSPSAVGFRNPAFRYLTLFFGAAAVQQAVVNIVSNREIGRAFAFTDLYRQAIARYVDGRYFGNNENRGSRTIFVEEFDMTPQRFQSHH
jgi:hypothetical protein